MITMKLVKNYPSALTILSGSFHSPPTSGLKDPETVVKRVYLYVDLTGEGSHHSTID